MLYLFPMVVALVWGVGRAIAAWWTSRKTEAEVPPVKKQTRPLEAKTRLRWLRAPALRWTLESALLLAIGAAVAVVSLDGSQKALLAVHYYACQRQWPQVLRASRPVWTITR